MLQIFDQRLADLLLKRQSPLPMRFAGTDQQKRKFFHRIYTELENRIKIFTSLPLASLDRFAIERQVKEIGKIKLPESD